MKNRPSLANLVAPTSMHGDEFVELVWENGRIVMRGSARKCVSGHSDGQVHHRTDCHNGCGGGSGDRGNGGGASETGNISSVDNTIPRKDFSLSSGVSDHKWVGQDQSRIHSPAQDNDHRHRTNNLVASDDKPMSINEVPRPSSWTTRMTSKNVDHLCRHLVGQCRSSTLLEGRTNSKPSSHSKGNCVNFSLFLRPTLVLKAHDQHGTGSTTLSRDSDRSLHVEQKPNDEIHGALGNGDAFDTSLLKQPSATEGKAKPIYADPKILAKATLDEHSEAVGCNDDSTRHKKSDEKCPNRSSIVGATTSEKMTPIDKVYCKPQPVASSSVCSREASNDLSGALKRSYDDSESTNTGEDADDEDDDDSDETDTMPTITAVHNKSERRQRRRINKRMRTLQELLPNCNKVDQASVLDEAIEYLKSLQRQLQIMSTARTPLFAPPMMFPRGTQPMSTLHLNQFPPLGVELGMKIGSGTFQFPISPISQATTLLGSSGSAVPMFGVQSMPYMPFVPTVTQPIQATNNAVEHLKSAAPSAIGEAIRN